MVGQLYAPGDPRRDAGFSIFYMGINIGALIAPIICGYLGEKVGWHWGFGAAGIGMTFGARPVRAGRHAPGPGGAAARRRRRTPGATWAPRRWRVIAAGAAVLWALWDYKDFVILAGTAGLLRLARRQGAHADRAQAHRRRSSCSSSSPPCSGAASSRPGPASTSSPQRFTRRVVFGWEFPAELVPVGELRCSSSCSRPSSPDLDPPGQARAVEPGEVRLALVFVGLGFLVVADRAPALGHGRPAGQPLVAGRPSTSATPSAS